MAASFRQISILLLVFLQASFPLASSAQLPSQPLAVPSGTLQLTLKEAVQLALKQNPQRVIAQLLVSESDRNSQIARSPLLPQASMKADGAINQYNFQTIERSRARRSLQLPEPYQYASKLVQLIRNPFLNSSPHSRLPDRSRSHSPGARR